MSDELGRLQEWFVAVVTDPRPLDDAARAHESLIGGACLDSVLLRSTRESAEERVSIYRHAYQARLVECLRDDYPATLFLLGEDEFERLAGEYIQRFPSRSPNLNAFGKHLPELLREHAQLGEAPSELATLEWALVEAIHSPTSATLDPETLRNVPPARLGEVGFRPHESARLLKFTHQVNAYAQAFFQDSPRQRVEPGDSAVVVARLGYKVWRLEASPAQATVLGRLWSGEPLARAFADVDVGPDEAMQWFRMWSEKGLFSALVVP